MARLVWRDLVTAAAPIARNIDGYLAHQGLQTGDVAAAASGRASRWVMEKVRKNARRPADLSGVVSVPGKTMAAQI
jgi:hypothetical protein